MKEKKIHHTAIHLKKRLAAKKKANLHCCIPETVVHTTTVEYEDGTTQIVNPDIQKNGNGKKWNPDSFYRECKAKRIAYLREHFKNTHYKKGRKKPWYMLTSDKCFNYEERTMSWGAMTKDFRVESEAKKFNDKYILPKLTKAHYLVLQIKNHMRDWDRKNPEPQKEIDGTLNAFYTQEHETWKTNRSNAYDEKWKDVYNTNKTTMKRMNITKILQQLNPGNAQLRKKTTAYALPKWAINTPTAKAA